MKKTSTFKGTTASYFGKTANIFFTDKAVEINIKSAWVMLLSLWVFAAAFFGISLLFEGVVISVVLTILGGIAGFILSSKFYQGKLTHSFNYTDISCFISNVPEFTIVDHDNKLFTVRALSAKHKSLITEMKKGVVTGGYTVNHKNGKYYLKQAEPAPSSVM